MLEGGIDKEGMVGCHHAMMELLVDRMGRGGGALKEEGTGALIGSDMFWGLFFEVFKQSDSIVHWSVILRVLRLRG